MTSVLTSGFHDPSEAPRLSRRAPVEPPQSPWLFPAIEVMQGLPAGHEIVAEGADVSPGSLLAGYRAGMFGMYEGDRLLWWSPDPRGVLYPRDVHVSRSMHRVRNRLSASLDQDFDAVLTSCADPSRPGGWITRGYAASYRRLHELGWAHSVEIWDGPTLAAGLFGVQLGSLFAAESMFHDPKYGANASRLAVLALCQVLEGSACALIDVQWPTQHLASLGVVQFPRVDYLRILPDLLAQPLGLPARPAASEGQPGQELIAPQVASSDRVDRSYRTALSEGSGTGPNRIRWVTGPAGAVVHPR